MLQLVRSIKSLDFSQLIAVYAESLGTAGSFTSGDYQNTLRAEQDFYQYLCDFFTQYDGIYALWVVDGCYCAALRLEPYRDGYLISGLETSPDQRNKGYAKQLLKSMLIYISQNAYGKIYSHIANSNSVSLHLHRSCGFQKILDYAVYIDGSVYHSSCTLCYET